jgi:hypothetical protein
LTSRLLRIWPFAMTGLPFACVLAEMDEHPTSVR